MTSAETSTETSAETSTETSGKTASRTGGGAPVLLVVMGVSGSGKTTVGAAVARRLGVAFADADDLHPPGNVAKMTAGVPLDEGDRRPWLALVGRWLAAHDATGGVISCSALRRAHRDQLRTAAPRVTFLHLHGTRAALARRLAGRTGHFMPASLLDSQLETLESLGPDEDGVVLDLDQRLEALVAAYLRASDGG